LGWPLVTGWRARQNHDALVRYPFATGKGIYTTAEDVRDLAALNGFLERFPPGATFFNFSGERVLHYFLQRIPPTRCSDVNMLSSPPLLAEAMTELEAKRPAFVVLAANPAVQTFDGVPPETRVPQLAQWIDAHYPNRTQMGRFLIATP
jgi:hypothetical protein